MIFHPRAGQRVRLHYAKQAASVMPYHGRTGIVRTVAAGPGPRNVGVEIDGRIVVVVRGNLVALPDVEERPKSTPADSTGAKEGGR